MDSRPALIGFIPTLTGIFKTGAGYSENQQWINIGDIVYTYAGAMLTAGESFEIWNFSMSAEEVNEKFSKVIFFIPCRIAPPPYSNDGYTYSKVIEFIEKLQIPFYSLSESIQSDSYEYEVDFHKKITPEVHRYLSVVSEKSPIVGVRGDYSAEVLNSLGIKNACPLGCPSLYVNGPQLKSALLKVPDNPRKIAGAYSNYQGNQRSRINDFLNLLNNQDSYYVEQTFGLLAKCLYYPGKLQALDFYRAEIFYKDFLPIKSLLSKNKVRYFTNYTTWKRFLSGMDFVVGARMHGLTPAIHAGIPSLFIAHDARVREMCEYFDLPFIAESNIPSNFNIAYLLDKCDYSKAFTKYSVRYKNFVQVLKKIGLGSNFDSDGNIIEYWEPAENISIAETELNPCFTEVDYSYFNEQLKRYEEIPKYAFENILEIDKLAEENYKARFKF